MYNRCGRQSGYNMLSSRSLRCRVLNVLHCRRMLIFVCVLVVLECLCVMAELMVDLHSLRVRFDHEELELKKFVNELQQDKLPSNNRINSIGDLVQFLETSDNNVRSCDCDKSADILAGLKPTQNSDKTVDESSKYKTDMLNLISSRTESSARSSNGTTTSNVYANSDTKARKVYSDSGTRQRNTPTETTQLTEPLSKHETMELLNLITKYPSVFKNIRSLVDKQKRSAPIQAVNRDTETCSDKVFVFSFQVNKSEHFFVRSFDELSSFRSEDIHRDDGAFMAKYYTLQNTSHLIKYIGFSILSVMVLETLLKIVCLGTMFLKKRIEVPNIKGTRFAPSQWNLVPDSSNIVVPSLFQVFDAFIVFVSFALDVVFIDSKWYETEKDATTILVLLLPWRIVRIVNSFLMTINHKHHIEMLMVRRSKKKVDGKLRKLKQLTLQMKRDIDLLISLAKLKGASQAEIINCIYSRGRDTKSLAAITGLASLMFISTLGKEPEKTIPQTDGENGDMYTDLLREILSEDETDIGQTTTDTIEAKDPYPMSDPDDPESEIFVISPDEADPDVKSKQPLRIPAIRRRVTFPRRHRSYRNDNPEGYENEGYEAADESAGSSATGSQFPPETRRSVKSMSNIDNTNDVGKNVLTFEFTTQVSYL